MWQAITTVAILGLLIMGVRTKVHLERWKLPLPFGQRPDLRAGSVLRTHWYQYPRGESPHRWGPSS